MFFQSDARTRDGGEAPGWPYIDQWAREESSAVLSFGEVSDLAAMVLWLWW